MQDDILLCCLPPYKIETPSPALSIIQSFLAKNHVNVKLKYLNIGFDNILCKYFKIDAGKFEEVIIVTLLNFGGFLDSNSILKMKSLLYEHRKKKYLSLLEFENEINKLNKDFKQYFFSEINDNIFKTIKIVGLSAKYNQWITGLIFSKLIKEKYPEIKIVIGGIDSIDKGITLLKYWKYFDFAIWGEGEYPLLKLFYHLSKDYPLKEVPQLIFKSNNVIKTNKIRNIEQHFANYNFPVYDDYFAYIKKFAPNSTKIELPINAVRGCNWNKCKFCVSRKGYKYLERSPINVVEEIKVQLKKYGISRFIFVDNCSFKDTNNLQILCNKLIELNSSYRSNLNIGLTINHTGLSDCLIDKLYLAGINRMQVGFESFSDNLLQLLKKENSICDNILFIKLVMRYNISLHLMILVNIPYESILDIIDSINNLHFFRFYLHNTNFNSHTNPIKIQHGSKYYNELDNEEIKKYRFNYTNYHLPSEISNIDKRKQIFLYHEETKHGEEWFKFINILNDYKKNKYSYKLIKDNGCLYYYEFLNGNEINVIVFDKPIYCDILKIIDKNICTLEFILQEISIKYPEIQKDEVSEVIYDLKSVYLLYHNKEFSQIVSCILL